MCTFAMKDKSIKALLATVIFKCVLTDAPTTYYFDKIRPPPPPPPPPVPFNIGSQLASFFGM
jgi:hypothetical protein